MFPSKSVSQATPFLSLTTIERVMGNHNAVFHELGAWATSTVVCLVVGDEVSRGKDVNDGRAIAVLRHHGFTQAPHKQ
jgi:hypothetical protein